MIANNASKMSQRFSHSTQLNSTFIRQQNKLETQ